MVVGWKKAFAALLVLLMVAAGCGASDGPADTASADDATASEAVEATGAEDDPSEDDGDGGGEAGESTDRSSDDADDTSGTDGEGTTWETYESPIQAFLGAPSFGPDEDNEEMYIEMERETQALVVECMSAQGFEYFPEDPERFADFEDPFEEDWGSEEWTKKWGFGVTTQAFGQSQVGPDLLGWPDEQMAFPSEEEMAEDPNQIYVESLSESEREAYYAVLWGNEPEITEDMTNEEIDELYMNWEPDGCYNEASEQVWGNGGFGDGGDVEGFYTEFGDQLDEIYERVQADPRIQAETDRINECMAAAGQPALPEDGDFWSLFYEDLEPLQEEVWASMDAFYEEQYGDEGIGEDSIGGEAVGSVDEVADEGAEDFFFEQPELTEDQKARLAVLQEREIATALALVECGGSAFGGLGDSEIFFEVMTEYEQEFLDANAAEIEQYRNVFGE